MDGFAEGIILGVLWQPPHAARHFSQLNSSRSELLVTGSASAVTRGVADTEALRHHAAATRIVRLSSAALGQTCSLGRDEL